MTTPLRVGVTPVRDDQYHRFAIVTGILPDRPRSREIHGEESLAANVTYEQAVLYADRFARLTDRMRDDGTPRVRLLADFERERAERGRPVDLRGIARHGADPASVLPSLWGTMLEHGFSGEDPEAALATGATLVSDSAEVVRLLQEGQAVWAFGVYGTENGQPPPSRDPDPFRSVRSPLPARSVGPNDFGLWDLSGQLREWVTVTRDSQTRPALKGGWVGDHLQGAGDEQTGFGKNFTDIDVGFRLAIEED